MSAVMINTADLATAIAVALQQVLLVSKPVDAVQEEKPVPVERAVPVVEEAMNGPVEDWADEVESSVASGARLSGDGVVAVGGVNSGPEVSATAIGSGADVKKAASVVDKAAGKDSTWAEVVVSGDGSSESSSVGVVAGDDGMKVVSTKTGFVARYVRVPEVEAVSVELQKMCGQKIPKTARTDLALARYTAATIPDAFQSGRDKYRRLAMLGDAALCTAVLTVAFRSGKPLQGMQQLRTTVLTDSFMARRMAGSALARHVVVVGGVDLATAKTGATALEAFAGILHLYCGAEAVVKYAVAMGLAAPLFGNVRSSVEGDLLEL